MSLIGFSRIPVPAWDRYDVWNVSRPHYGFRASARTESRAADLARDLSVARRGERFEVRLVKGRPGVGPESVVVAAFRNGEEVV